MGILEKKEVNRMVQELMETRSINMDIRNYPRRTCQAISEYLLKKQETFAKITYPNLGYPGTFLWISDINCGPYTTEAIHKEYTMERLSTA